MLERPNERGGGDWALNKRLGSRKTVVRNYVVAKSNWERRGKKCAEELYEG